MTVFFISLALVGAIILGIVLKLRKMPKYKLSKEGTHLDGEEKWFVKIRKGFSYFYLTQTHDAPGFENDIFATSSHPSGGQDTETLANNVIINHRMTTVNGIEIEG
jgi:hypothetical protein